MKPSLQEVQDAHRAIDWSEATCAVSAQTNPAVALIFDEPTLNPEKAAVARTLCIRCPILETCLQYAIKYETPMDNHPQTHHSDTLLAGFTLEQRRNIKALPSWQKVYGDK